jgi:DNA-binding transcriptional LysR family regulator
MSLLHEDVTPELLRLVATHELAAAAVLETPAAARHHRVRIDALRDEPMLAALPASHRYANANGVPNAAFVAEPVLLPRKPEGLVFNSWFRAVVRAAARAKSSLKECLDAASLTREIGEGRFRPTVRAAVEACS